ncbi:hypothetical protein ACFQ2T_04845 [Methylophilus flavus]|uniref:Peptidase M15A C-terminal domain-containing protein n=1 Tax=Methylophilus flavus TaxID=640084 RepID=A0ABW3PB11_9PROT
MITIEQYVGKWSENEDWTEVRQAYAAQLLIQVNKLLEAAKKAGIELKNNPNTDSLISGTQYGGFRPQSCPIGAAGSSHKQGQAVDIFDPQNKLDGWINDAILTQYGLYREHPDATIRWCHLSTRAPKSGRRTFLP